MVLTFVIAGLFLFAAAVFLWSILSPALRLKGREPEAVDLQSYLNLLDPAQLEYLKLHTTSAQYRELLRHRRRALAAYLQQMARSSALALQAADTVLAATPAPEMELAARRLVSAALDTRTYALNGLLFLRFGSFLPGEVAWLQKTAVHYQTFNEALVGRGFTALSPSR